MKHAKFKAKELISKMFDLQWRQGAYHNSDKEFRNACKCALIVAQTTIDELKEREIHVCNMCSEMDVINVATTFWGNVKFEIEYFLNGNSVWDVSAK